MTRMQTEGWGIFSVVCDNDDTGIKGYENNLMYSPYSSGHTGFCIGFSLEKLLTPFQPDPFFMPVKNKEDFPILIPYKADVTKIER